MQYNKHSRFCAYASVVRFLSCRYMWYILNLVRTVINTNKYSTSLISKISKITMIDIKIYETIVFFVAFAGGRLLYSSMES